MHKIKNTYKKTKFTFLLSLIFALFFSLNATAEEENRLSVVLNRSQRDATDSNFVEIPANASQINLTLTGQMSSVRCGWSDCGCFGHGIRTVANASFYMYDADYNLIYQISTTESVNGGGTVITSYYNGYGFIEQQIVNESLNVSDYNSAKYLRIVTQYANAPTGVCEKHHNTVVGQPCTSAATITVYAPICPSFSSNLPPVIPFILLLSVSFTIFFCYLPCFLCSYLGIIPII